MKLMISEKIYRYRKEKDMTQEELAAALDVTPQAVSNWERGGYPDITLLPGLANLFGVTIDELMGNDEISRHEDYKRYEQAYKELGACEERLELSLEYYRKYPAEPFYMNRIAGNIEYLMLEDPAKREKYMPLLNEVCDKLLDKPLYREYAIRVMTVVCPEEELDHWLKMSTVTSEYTRRGNLLHRYMQRDDIEGWRIQSQLQMIEKFTLLFDTVCPDQLGPEKKGEYLRSQLAMMEWLKTDGTMPDGWLLHYAYKKLVLAACLFATDKTDEGWAEFEESMALYRKWFSFPKDALLDLGGGELFGGLRVPPDWYYCFSPSGEKHRLFEHTRLFFYTPDRLRDFLNNPRWAWYNSARSDPRYIAAVEWADSLTKNE